MRDVLQPDGFRHLQQRTLIQIYRSTSSEADVQFLSIRDEILITGR
jgi:hypothetical protein